MAAKPFLQKIFPDIRDGKIKKEDKETTPKGCYVFEPSRKWAVRSQGNLLIFNTHAHGNRHDGSRQVCTTKGMFSHIVCIVIIPGTYLFKKLLTLWTV